MNHTKNLVLVGMMGSGKSTIGLRIAQALKMPFYDVDKEIEKKAHCSISEIFQQEGETAFRDLEHEIIQDLIQRTPCVISTGGGAFVEKRNRDLLKQTGIIFYLSASAEILFERTQHTSHRPLLQTDNPLQSLKDLLEKRAPFYEQADHKINVEKASPAEIVEQLKALYLKTT